MIRPFLKTILAVSTLLALVLSSPAALRHRYSFDGDANDSVGGANATLAGTNGSIVGGMVELPGGGIDGVNAYVSLPAGAIAINTYTSVTFQGWFRFDAVAGNFQKLFSFGERQVSPDWAGMRYIIGGVRQGGGGISDASISSATEADDQPWTKESNVPGPTISVGTHHMAVTIDDTEISLYVDGEWAGTTSLITPVATNSLDQVSVNEAYLGRSAYADALLGGAIDEFRILDTAQTALEIAIDVGLGANDVSGDPGAEVSRSVLIDPLVIDGSKPAVLSIHYAGISEPVQLRRDASLVWSSSDSNVVSVTQDGTVTAHSAGPVTLTATLDGVPTTTPVQVQGTTLKHRWAFNGPAMGTDTNNTTFVEPDLVGSADGTVVGPNAARLGNGTLELSANATGDTLRANGYVDLPNGIISALSSMTLETWVTPRSTDGGWERIFDVGTTTIGEVLPGNTTGYSGSGTDWFYLTAYRNQTPNISIRREGAGQEVVPLGISWFDTLPDAELHVVATYNTSTGEGHIYVDGELVDSGPLGGSLANLPDVNVWLGRSIWQGDANLNGLFNEFRIYEGVLSPREVGISAQLGADDPVGEPGAAGARSIVADATVVREGAKSVMLSVQYANLGSPVVFQTDPGLTWSSSDTNILTVTDAGVMTGVSAGTATLTASFDGMDTTQSVTVGDPQLVHRYSFNGAQNSSFDFIEPDLVGGADATVFFAAERNGVGQVDLQYGFSGYIDLPNGIISPLGSATFEAWLTPRDPGPGWERAFSFGNSTFQDATKSGELDEFTIIGYAGSKNLFMAARTGTAADLRYATNGDELLVPGISYAVNTPIHVVAVYNAAAQEGSVYLDGVLAGSDDVAFLLDQLPDVNNWLGRSSYEADGYLDALYDEFRIYEGVLTPLEIAVNNATGPDGTPFVDPGDGVTAVTLVADPTSLIAETDGVQSFLYADFTNVSDVPVSGLEGTSFHSEDTNIVTVSDTGFVDPVGPGTVKVWGNSWGSPTA